jgi:DNA-binding transcriptional regulator YdaS (Cro superfamily)
MAPEQADPVTTEVTRFFASDTYGLISAVARAVGATPPSVTQWASGATRPDARWWPELEAFFGQRPGHLSRVASGELRPGSTEVTFSVRRDRRSKPATQTAAPDRLDLVLAELADLRTRIERLEAGGGSGRPGRPTSVTDLTGRRAAQEPRYRKGVDGPPDGQDD